MSRVEQQPAELGLFGCLDQLCGYRTHTLGFARALSRHYPLRLQTGDALVNPACLSPDLRRLLDPDPHPKPEIALAIGGINNFPRLPGRFRIGYAVFETTLLPRRLLRVIDALDQVWVPSTWCRTRLIAQGIPGQRIQLVPEGVDLASYNGPPSDRRRDNVFRFLCVGKWEKRKCQDQLVRTFIETFAEDAPVELVLHCHNTFAPSISPVERIRKLTGGSRHRILFSDELPQNALCDLYRSCDAFLLPSRGEAWGLPITEAMAAGLPVVTTAHAGPLDFLDPAHAFLLPVKRLVRVRDHGNYPAGWRYGHWAEPDWRALAATMRYLVANPGEARRIGQQGRRYAQRMLDWDRAARIAAGILRGISGQLSVSPGPHEGRSDTTRALSGASQ